MEFMKNLLLRFVNVVSLVVNVVIVLMFLYVNGLFLTNIVNEWNSGAYVDVTFGVQAMLVYVALVIIPLAGYAILCQRK